MTRNGLRSFAAGLLLATAVLSYFYFQNIKAGATPAASNSPTEERTQLTETDVKSFADKNNLVILSEKEFEKLNEQANQQADKNVVYQLQLDVPKGTSSQEVTSKLFNAKIISDKDEFRDYLHKNKLETAVKSGSYTLNSEMSIKEIVDIITK